MADYAPNFTARYKLTYSSEGDQHQCVTRWPSANTQIANVAAAITFWTFFFNDTEDLRHTSFTVLGAEYAAADSNTFLPVDAPTEVAAGTIATASGPTTAIIHTNWAGRSALGAKMRFMMFGLRWNLADSTTYLDFRVSQAEDVTVAVVAGRLLAAGMVGPDDEALAQVYNRVSIKPNDAWVRIRRQGG